MGNNESPKKKQKSSTERTEIKKKVKDKYKGPRIPRPLGITYLAIQIQKEPNPQKQEELRNSLYARVIDQYVSNCCRLNNRSITIDQLATFLNLDTTRVLMLMNKSFTKIVDFFDRGEGKTMARAFFLQALKKSLEIQSQTESQVALLLASQGREYKPFLTSEVNRSITNLINSQRPVHDILKLFSEQNNTSSLLNPVQNTQNNIYITADEASKILEKQGTRSLLTDGDMLAQQGQILTQSLPAGLNVNAKFQDLNSIGIRHDGTKDLDQDLVEIISE